MLYGHVNGCLVCYVRVRRKRVDGKCAVYHSARRGVWHFGLTTGREHVGTILVAFGAIKLLRPGRFNYPYNQHGHGDLDHLPGV